ncbi:hypothetical protein [Streptomyces xanthochromogenes]|uniref:hypothetical protein n=1 Tax=Streptomyces xanthochromogenes TaxID=67384 RepID=UPI003449562D
MIEKAFLTSMAAVAGLLLLTSGASAADGPTTIVLHDPDGGASAKDTCQPSAAAGAPGPVGITSFGISCATPFLPGVYTRVHSGDAAATTAR